MEFEFSLNSKTAAKRELAGKLRNLTKMPSFIEYSREFSDAGKHVNWQPSCKTLELDCYLVRNISNQDHRVNNAIAWDIIDKVFECAYPVFHQMVFFQIV